MGWLVAGFNSSYFWWFLYQQLSVHLVQLAVAISLFPTFNVINTEGPPGFVVTNLALGATSSVQALAIVNITVIYALGHLR